MNREEALAVLREKLAAYRQSPYGELQAKVGEGDHFNIVGPSGVEYQVEVQVFWESAPDGNLLVVGSVDDGGLRAFMPLTESLLVEPAETSAD